MNFLPSHLPPARHATCIAFLESIKGPDFLFIYAVWFLLIRIILGILRKGEQDTPQATLGALVLFEGLGFFRIWDGSNHGMHKWELLIVEMLIGGFLMVVRLDQLPSGGGGTGGSCSSSSCSSGGGGGCGGGGGGCGGCGGS